MRKRLLVLISAGFVVSASALLTATSADDGTPQVKDVMKSLFKGKSAELAKLKTELKNEPPDWSSVEASAKQFVNLTAALGKATPPKGDKASWEKLTLAVHENSKVLDGAAKSKDKARVEAAAKKIGGMCQSCHAAHKGQ